MDSEIQDMQDISEEYKKPEKIDYNDYKMVTFTLGGKDYGIDIMKVKEILKVNKFTYVPNSEPYVRGVYNLRGDIISIIDLRVMFRVVSEDVSDNLQDIIVLNIDDKRIGVIVDAINKVVGVPGDTIQPPHPIFSGINIKYIRGVVNKESKIYIILDVDRILGDEAEEPETSSAPGELKTIPVKEKYPVTKPPSRTDAKSAVKEEDINSEFIKETLKTFIGFHVTDLNKAWFDKRYKEWSEIRRNNGENIQLSCMEDAAGFLTGFYSSNTGRFFSEADAEKLKKILPSTVKGNYYVWNIGCANGFETYSFTAVIKDLNPDAAVKVWANDKDLLNISNAPNLLFNKENIPDYLRKYCVSGVKGESFSQELKDLIYFEFHDVKNHNPYPDADLIICRDVFSFFDYNEQIKVISEIYDKLKENGILITGDNEVVSLQGLVPVEEAGLRYYRKKP